MTGIRFAGTPCGTIDDIGQRCKGVLEKTQYDLDLTNVNGYEYIEYECDVCNRGVLVAKKTPYESEF